MNERVAAYSAASRALTQELGDHKNWHSTDANHIYVYLAARTLAKAIVRAPHTQLLHVRLLMV